MYFVSYGTSFLDSNASFRIPWGLQMIPAFILLGFLPFMPRSPRWLASQDRWEEALSTLAMIRSKGDIQNVEVLAEIQLIRERVQYVASPRQTHHLSVRYAHTLLHADSSQAGVTIQLYLLVRALYTPKHCARACRNFRPPLGSI